MRYVYTQLNSKPGIWAMPSDLFGRPFILLCSLLIGFFFISLNASPEEEFPVLYKGRYRPAEAYARLWLYEMYHSPTLKQADLAAFHTTSTSPFILLWSFDLLGGLAYQNAPLFWIRSAEVKQLAQLPLTRDRFSYQELQDAVHQNPIISNKKLADDWATLLASLKEFERLQSGPSSIELAFRDRLAQLQTKNVSPKEIERTLERDYPLIQRLQMGGPLFKSLPSRYKDGEWFPVKALTVQMYHPSTNRLKPVGNFTLFSDAHFDSVRQAYLTLEKTFAESSHAVRQENLHRFAIALQQAYQPLAGKIFQEAHGKQLTYPSFTQLKIETLYVGHPWIPLLILLYALAACLWMISYRIALPFGNLAAISITGFAILCHTGLLAMRCYILERPPVSNMFETVLYVPWIATCFSLLFPTFRRQPLVLISACLTSMILLLILEVTDLNQSLDQVQAVLDSQFWLMIHVLLVVGSYGIFILGALIGHFYLGLFLLRPKETPTLTILSQIILQTMYGGTALLLIGTILGGIWAAESWGRFWDWDPKESWAFISICFYLIWIHAYRFHQIASFGLAMGAVSGLLAISFTWYGVNYILGTGLHSYGFGSGGEHYYYAFLGAEGLFLTAVYIQNKFQIC
jgi:ABC-type transport system involved in cytochrome c biogenesis permease subunit